MPLSGIIPITLTPFDTTGAVDAPGLRRVVRFELDGGVTALGVNGFASEAYKLSEDERYQVAEIVAAEAAGAAALIIGMFAGSTEHAVAQARRYARLAPAALMVLPPNTMALDEAALVAHYADLAAAVDVPIMVQQSPQILAYAGVQCSTEALVALAERAPGVQYFKIEGPGSAERIAALHARLGSRVTQFGGIGGLGLRAELEVGANGLLPGCGFNEVFTQTWAAWTAGDAERADAILRQAQPLVTAVSGSGHEFSLHARKHLFQRKGIIASATVRRPTVAASADQLAQVAALADALGLRISL